MLVTKHEAAQLLRVSVRTVERLVAAGRLQQVQVERLARFRDPRPTSRPSLSDE
jgi:excisionase family DNA binding protein